MTAITPDLILMKALGDGRLDLALADGKRGIFDCGSYRQYEFMEARHA